MSYRDDVCRAIFAEEQRCQAVIGTATDGDVQSPQYAHLNGRLLGLQRARDIDEVVELSDSDATWQVIRADGRYVDWPVEHPRLAEKLREKVLFSGLSMEHAYKVATLEAALYQTQNKYGDQVFYPKNQLPQ